MQSEQQLIDSLAETSPGAAALARVVSLAVLIEPQLLRRARLALLKGVDAGAEADLWLSPLVQTRSPRGITLLPPVAARLRQELAATPDLFKRAWSLTEELHRASPRTVILEENINRLSARLNASTIGEIEALLRSVANTLVLNEEHAGLANWAASALPRLPPQVRRLEWARILAGAAYLRLSARLPVEEGASGHDLPEWLSWALPKDLPPVELGVQLVEGGVLVGGAAPPSHTIRVPGTNPLLVELSWAGEGGRRLLRLKPGERRTVKAPPGEVQVRTAQGARYVIAPGAEPEPEAPEPEKEAQRLCFVVMGFGEKVDFQTGRKLNLDASYHNMIKPAVEGAGFACLRADEIAHSGLIDVPMYEHLLKADVVIADLSTYNPNAFYELGVRHALKPYVTIVIAEDKLNYPFDVNSIVIRRYRHLGDDLGASEARRFGDELKRVLLEAVEKPSPDSPVYNFLSGLTPPTLAGASEDVAQAAASQPAGGAGQPAAEQSHSTLMQSANEAIKVGDFASAKTTLSNLRWSLKRADPNRPEDPYVIQRLALATYRSKLPTPQSALEEARDLLSALGPATSNDTETLGIWGEVHKRMWGVTGEVAHLDEAVRGYERGFYLRNDYYNGINLAFLLNVRAARASAPAAAIADFVQARRIRREVLAISREVLDDDLPDERKYWLLTTMAEAHLGTGDEAAAAEKLSEAQALSPARWMVDSTQEQLDKLRQLLADSPLKYIRAEAA